MEQSTIRTILLAIGSLIVLGILWNGLRRKLQRRKNVNKTQSIYDCSDEKTPHISELPEMDDAEEPKMSDVVPKTNDVLPASSQEVNPESPMSFHEVSAESSTSFQEASTESPASFKKASTESPTSFQKSGAEPLPSFQKTSPEPLASFQKANAASLSGIHKPHQTKDDKNEQPAKQPNPFPSEITSITIMAPPNKPFGGYDLLQTIFSHDMHYGDMQIFHRYKNGSKEAGTLFSLASATEPGDFDLDNIGKTICTGLVLFMKPTDHENTELVLDEMSETAQQLADDLGGTLN